MADVATQNMREDVTTLERGFYRAQDTITVLVTQAFAEQLIESSHARVFGPAGSETDWPYVLLVEAAAPAVLGLALLGGSKSKTVQSIGTGLLVTGAARGLRVPIRATIKAAFGPEPQAESADAADDLAYALASPDQAALPRRRRRKLPAPSVLIGPGLTHYAS